MHKCSIVPPVLTGCAARGRSRRRPNERREESRREGEGRLGKRQTLGITAAQELNFKPTSYKNTHTRAFPVRNDHGALWKGNEQHLKRAGCFTVEKTGTFFSLNFQTSNVKLKIVSWRLFVPYIHLEIFGGSFIPRICSTFDITGVDLFSRIKCQDKNHTKISQKKRSTKYSERPKHRCSRICNSAICITI